MTKNSSFSQITPFAAISSLNPEAVKPCGAAELCTNLRTTDDALAAVGTPATVATARPHERIIAVDGQRIIMACGNELRYNGNTIATAGGDIVNASVIGNFILVFSTAGKICMKWNGSSYNVLDPLEAIPTLRLAESQVATHTVNIPAILFRQPYDRWQTPLDNGDISTLNAQVLAAWRDAITAANISRRFTGPVLARVAVRLWDDSVLWTGQPVLLGGEMLNDSHIASATVTVSGSTFTGAGEATASLRSFKIGVEVVSGIGSDWLELIKSIEVYATAAVCSIDLNSSINYQCATSVVGGTRSYYLNTIPATVNPTVAFRQLVERRWQLVASTSDLAALNNGTFNGNDVLDGSALSVSKFALATFNLNHPAQGACAISYNGRLYHAPASRQAINTWSPECILTPSCTSATTAATVTATLATENGDLTVTTQWQMATTDVALNPLVAFPDTRAKHLSVLIGNREINVDLQPWHDGNLAFFINPTLQVNNLTDSTAAHQPVNHPVETCRGTLDIGTLANPFCLERSVTASGETIRAIAPAAKPIFSGAFGRYPVYVFTENGIFALPQSTSGKTGEARLIDNIVIHDHISPVAGNKTVWFLDRNSRLCALEGSTVQLFVGGKQWTSPEALAWNERYRELLIVHDGGSLAAVQQNHTFYTRDLVVNSIFNDTKHCLAILDDCSIVDLENESNSITSIEYLSQPLIVDEARQLLINAVEWNVFGNNLNLNLTLRADNAQACHGAIVSRLTVNGICNCPLVVATFARAKRTLRLHISGTAPCGTLLRYAKISFKTTKATKY